MVARTVLAVLSLALVLPCCAAAAEKLVAPVYPGSLRTSPERLTGAQPVVFLVKDAHDKVVEFYVPAHARKPTEDEGQERGDNRLPLIVQDYQKVTADLVARKGDYTLARATEVFVEWQPEFMAQSGPAESVFAELRSAARKDPALQAELVELRKQYGGLGCTFYSGQTAMDILKRTSTELNGAPPTAENTSDMVALGEKMQKLAMAGRFEEMAKLSEQLKSASGGGAPPKKRSKAEVFAEWKKALVELEKNAYRTRVTIDRDPSLWR